MGLGLSIYELNPRDQKACEELASLVTLLFTDEIAIWGYSGMTINRAVGVRKGAKNVDTFIGGAPDATRKGVIRGKREQITITPELLAKVDALASRMGQSRAALINRAIYELAERVQQ